ncbi:MAG: GGDEF domain-containing protein [Butyrivibrio sp.]|nr:GGDEF domain-containing protein [Butyrivibrio sp.]
MLKNKISREEREDFYQSKYKYFRKVSSFAAIITALCEISYFVSDCQIFGRFAYETLVPRLSILVPLILFIILAPKVTDYKKGALLNYLIAHGAMWATIWAIVYLPNKDFSREGFIIMHFAFLATGLAIPLKIHIPVHGLLLLNIIVSNTFNHYPHFDLMISLALPLYIGCCVLLYIFENVYADQYLMTRELQKTSITDSLTEVYNRNKLEDIVDEKDEHLKVGHKLEAVILMIDIDYFKRVNDTYGHDAGDKVLVSVAEQIKKCIRSTDIVIRWGGEEFVVVLSGAESSVGLNIAEHIRSGVESTDNEVCPVTVSVGVSRYDGGNYSQAVKHADEALYYAKEHGRNLVVHYDDLAKDES